MTKYLYQARVLPVGRPTTLPDDAGRPVTFVFDQDNFSLSRSRAHDIPVCIGHDHGLEIGNLRSLTPNLGWWVACFELNDELGIEFEVGQPVSVGLTWHDRSVPSVEELSIVRRGLVDGAAITHRMLKPKPNPAPTPEPARTTEVVEVIQQAVVYRQPAASARDQAEEAEMRRRLQWLEKHTGRCDVEAVVLGMRRELDGPTPEELLARHDMRRVV